MNTAATFDPVQASLTELRHQGQVNRAWIWVTAVSLVLNSVLTIGLYFYADQANNASHQAQVAVAATARNTETIYLACQNSNEVRSESKQLWQFVIDTDTKQLQSDASKAPAAELAQAKKIVADFQNEVNVTYKPQDCSKVKS